MSAHKEHSQTQETRICKHTNTNRRTHTRPTRSDTHTLTRSQVMSEHTQQYTFCSFVRLSLCEHSLSVGPSSTYCDHCVLTLPPASLLSLFFLLPSTPHTTYPLSLCQLMHTGLHCSEVGACHGSKHSTESTDMHVRASRAE